MSHTTLVCLGFAGAGASFFHPWREIVPAGLDLRTPQLPGREWRFEEEPPADVGAAADLLLAELAPELTGQRVALFGQCFGAVLAFELALRLTDVVEVVHLFPSGAPSPWTRGPVLAAGLDDDELVRRVREDIGYDHEALDEPELRELIVPALRADMESHEKYSAAPDARLDVPVTAVRGRTDPVVDTAGMGEWARATTAAFTLAEFDGAHMYLVDEAAALLALVEKAVAPA